MYIMFVKKEIKEIIRKEREDQSYKDHLLFEEKLKSLSEKHSDSFLELTNKHNGKIKELTDYYEEELKSLKKEKEETAKIIENRHKIEIKEINRKNDERTHTNNRLYKEQLNNEIAKINSTSKEKLTQQSNKIKELYKYISSLNKKVKSYKKAYDMYENLRTHLEKVAITTHTAAEKSQIYSTEIYKQLAEIHDEMESHTRIIEKLKPKINKLMEDEEIVGEENV